MKHQNESTSRPLGGAPRRIFGGYGPLLALVVAFLLVVTMVPTIAREQLVAGRTSAEQVLPGAPLPARAGTSGTVPGAATPGAGVAAPGGASGRAGVAVPSAAGPQAVQASRRTSAAPAAAKAAGPCADRRVQILGDTYSPPCIAWKPGRDTGGATSRGVSKDKIRIGFRLPVEDIRDYQSIIAQLTGGKGDAIPAPTEADVRRTVDGFVKYFNRNFQFYGRKIELVEWKGKGSAINEIVGAGQEAANADAIRAAKELKVFADVSAFTQPYNDALARQGVVAIGAPYMSRQWFAKHAPYSWSPFPDCTTLAENIAEYLNKRVFGHPAEHAGPGLAGKARKVALVAPDNPEYQQCADAGEKIIKAAGNEAGRYHYTLDLATLSDQANNIASKLKKDGITTVVLATDPLLPLLLTSRMSQQEYYPEWVVTGTALTDLDIVGQFYDQSQWKHAFGLVEPRRAAARGRQLRVRRVQDDLPRPRAGVRLGAPLLLLLHGRDRDPHGRARPDGAHVRRRHARLPGGPRPGRDLGLPRGGVHPVPGLARDLVGP